MSPYGISSIPKRYPYSLKRHKSFHKGKFDGKRVGVYFSKYLFILDIYCAG